jgi:hypothetical protein
MQWDAMGKTTVVDGRVALWWSAAAVARSSSKRSRRCCALQPTHALCYRTCLQRNEIGVGLCFSSIGSRPL